MTHDSLMCTWKRNIITMLGQSVGLRRGLRFPCLLFALVILLRSFLVASASFVVSRANLPPTRHDKRAQHQQHHDAMNDGQRMPVIAEADDEQEMIESQRYTRFSGIGRIYADTDDDNPQSSRNDANREPHLAVVDRLYGATVCVIGVGGVGSWAAEALVRSGVGNVILVDADDVCISNTNRQLHAVSSSIGQMKVDEMKRRLLDINPQCNVTTILDFVTVDNVHATLDVMLPQLTVCLDAIDGAKEKTALIAACVEREIPIVTCGGAAGKRDATQIVVDDLTRVSSDRMLATCRKNLRQQHGFERGLSFQEKKMNKRRVRNWGIAAVYSTEPTNSLPADDGVSSFRRCDGALGTACFVTGSFGFAAAGRVVEMIAKDKLVRPRK